ncbi:YlxR family protein [Thermodesulforhabdus norvegica]|nr:YlxR family protein [Thermodesulforhabdus norvegica]
MARRGHRPVRMCVVCRERRYKDELIRLAVDEDGMVVVDSEGRMPGRGAYVCPGCVDYLKWGKTLINAFKGRARGFKGFAKSGCREQDIF